MGAVRGIAALIGPFLFTLMFYQFAGPWRSYQLTRRAVLLCRRAGHHRSRDRHPGNDARRRRRDAPAGARPDHRHRRRLT